MPEAKNKAKNKKTGIRKNPKSAAMPKKSKPGVQKKPEIKAIPKDSGLNVHKTRIKVLGIGGGAGAILSDISLKIKRADFILANTDARAIRGVSSKIKKFQFGEVLTKGLGTGMDFALGEESAQKEKGRIKKIFNNCDVCIIISCLGGGTGSGAMPVFAKIGKSAGVLMYGIFTLPFNFEGGQKRELADISILKARPFLNAYSVIPNEKIFEAIDRNTPIKEALSVVNKKISEDLQGLIETIYSPGLINIDFADIKSILNEKGKTAFLNAVEIDKNNIAAELKKITFDVLCPYNIKGAKGALYNIFSGPDLCLDEISEISKTIFGLISKKAKIIFGINQSFRKQNKIKIVILAVGCDLERKEKTGPEKQKEKEKKNLEKPKNNKQKKIKKEPVKEPLKEPGQNPPSEKISVKRRNGMEIKKETEKKKEEFLEEDPFETPAILRKFDSN